MSGSTTRSTRLRPFLASGVVVHGSTLALQATSASNPSGSTTVAVYDSGGIDGNTDWANQSCGTDSSPGSHCTYVATSQPFTGTGPVNLDISSIMVRAVSSGWTNWTFLLATTDETNDAMRHHFSTNPQITTTYDIAPVISTPRETPTPTNASTGDTAQCDHDQPYWIGASQNVTLTVNNSSPVGLPLNTTFNLWDNDDSTFSWSGNSGWAGSSNPNGVSVGVGSLKDGHQYGWNAQASDTDGSSWGLSSPLTTSCHFRIDKTPPTVSVTSTDFPPSGTVYTPTKFSTDAGTFTITGTDPVPAGGTRASGVACYRWSTNPTPVTNWHCSDPSSPSTGIVQAATPSFTYTPGTWGTNILYVQAQDNAGNYSQPVAYSFYAPWNPNSKPVYGDLTGDGKPDITLPDGNGNLRVIQNTGDPTNAGWVSALGITAPGGAGWNGLQITHRSTLRVPAFASDDLIVHKPGDPMMYLYTNKGQGTYNAAVPFYPSGSATPSQVTCVDTTGQPVVAVTQTNKGCPTGVGYDFSQVSQILALGNPDNEITTAPLSRTTLVCVINGQLWMIPPGGSATLLKKTDTQLSSAPWDGSNGTDGYDLIGPGPANGTTSWTDTSNTVHTVNQATLWARDRKTGQILSFAITKNADGTTSFANLADPTKLYSTNPPSPGATVIGGGVDTTTYPVVGSVGDFTGDGVPDLYAVTADNKLVVWPGKTADGTSATAVNGFGNAVTLGDVRAPLGRWRLNDAAGSTTAADTTGAHPLTASGGAAFGSDAVNGTAATVASFNGSSSVLAAGGPVVDTGKSFTVSLWAKATASGGVIISQDGTNASGFQLWPSNRGSAGVEWRFGMAASDTAGATIDQTDTPNANALVTYGTWAQLTASYNATTGELLLYVNGALASTGLHHNGFNATGPLVLGRFKQNGSPAAFFNGSVAEVSVFQYAASPTTTGPTVIQSGTNPVKCVDNNNAQTADGNPVQVWDCYPGITAQSWNLNADGTITQQGKCLDVNNGTPADGTPVQLWTCNAGNPNQQWLPTGQGLLYNPASGRCLDDPNASTSNGARLQVWTCYGGIPAQSWKISGYAPIPRAAQPGV